MTKKVKITSRGRYALMSMVALCKIDQDLPVPLSRIAESNKLSLSYLEQLFSAMRRQGLVVSTRGPGGGYRLTKKPSDIMITDILAAAEDIATARDTRSMEETKGQSCELTQRLFDQVGEVLYKVLETVTLDDVLKGKPKKLSF